MNAGPKILDLLKKVKMLPRKQMDKAEQDFVRRYLGSSKNFLGVRSSDIIRTARIFLKDNKAIDSKSLVEILTGLFSTRTGEDHLLGGKIFTFLRPEQRQKIPLSILKKWLKQTTGWIECDVICQSAFTGLEVANRWEEWHENISDFSRNPNIQIRRASLVLQVKSVSQVYDKRFRALAFETIERLKPEKEVLITKAISWLLRALVNKDRDEVNKYIASSGASLPRIAVRETLKKIETGRKTARKGKDTLSGN